MVSTLEDNFNKNLEENQWRIEHETHLAKWTKWTELYTMGLNLLPAKIGEKHPCVYWKCYQEERVTLRQWNEWRNKRFSGIGSYNTFLVCAAGDIPLVVVDCDDQRAIDFATRWCDPTPLTVSRCKGKRHLYYRHPGEYVKTVSKITINDETFNLDIRGDGGGVVAPYSVHSSGEVYLPSLPITRDLLLSLPVYDPSWLPYQSSGNGSRESTTGLLVPYNEDYQIMVEDSSLPDLETRLHLAQKYLAKCPGTTQGNKADAACLAIVRKVVIGFALPEIEAVDLIMEVWADRDDQLDAYNNQYSWNLKEIIHKVQSVIRTRDNQSWCRFASMLNIESREWMVLAEELEVTPIVVEEKTDKVALDDFKNNPLYSYLWKGNHVRLDDNDRKKRIMSVEKIRKLMPTTGFFPDYLRYQLPSSDCPVIYHLASALGLVGHILNRKVRCQFGNDYIYPLMWVGVLGPSSIVHKSHAINGARKLLEEMEHYSNTIIPDDFSFEGLLTHLGFNLKPLEEGKDSGLPNWKTTEEKCKERERYSKDNDMPYIKGIGMFHLNEIGGWLARLSTNQNTAVKETLTAWYDCPIRYHRTTKTQGDTYLYRPFPSILGASTQEWLIDHCTQSDIDGGFLPRWLFFDATTKDYILTCPDTGDITLRQSLVEQLDAMARQYVDLELPDGEVKDHYHLWRTKLEKDATGDRTIQSWVNRLGIYAIKVAMIYEVSMTSQIEHISIEAMKRATKLIDYLLSELKHILDNVAFDEDGKSVNKVKKIIQASGASGIKHGAALKRAKMQACKFNAIIDTLAQQEVIAKREKTYYWLVG
jgi:hypothetical protein